MIAGAIIYREARDADLPGITRVRTSVAENHLSVAQMEARGITEASVIASFRVDKKGWVGEYDGEVVAFAIADRASRSIFALFVRPAFQGRGIGGRLLDLAAGWLWDCGSRDIWLTTRKGTRAAAFYARRGWTATGIDPEGNVRYECERPENRDVASTTGRPGS